jgi:hypothetical protein
MEGEGQSEGEGEGEEDGEEEGEGEGENNEIVLDATIDEEIENTETLNSSSSNDSDEENEENKEGSGDKGSSDSNSNSKADPRSKNIGPIFIKDGDSEWIIITTAGVLTDVNRFMPPHRWVCVRVCVCLSVCSFPD